MSFRDIFCGHFYITTSGNFSNPALLCCVMEMGADRILFSVDWPFENVDHACHWFDDASISETDRLKIGRTNALELFKLNRTKPQIQARAVRRGLLASA